VGLQGQTLGQEEAMETIQYLAQLLLLVVVAVGAKTQLMLLV
jgi:hypothetical protein